MSEESRKAWDQATKVKCEHCKKTMFKSESSSHRCHHRWTGKDAAEFEEQPDFLPYFGSDY